MDALARTTERRITTESMRNRIIELLKRKIYPREGVDPVEAVADYLIDNNVVALPCKVGDTVYTNTSMSGWYMREKDKPYRAEVVFIGLNSADGFMNVVLGSGRMLQFNFSQIGSLVFLTRETAEKALKESGSR